MNKKVIGILLTVGAMLFASCSVRKETKEPWRPGKVKSKAHSQQKGRV